MSDDREFFRELWAFIGTLEPSLPKTFVAEVYNIGWSMSRGVEADWRRELCWCVAVISKSTGIRMPESIHDRVALGPRNLFAEKYIRFVEARNNKWNI